MKKSNLLYLGFVLSVLGIAIGAATPTGNIPISQMPISATLKTNAWIPIIQPIDGRTTNDNFRVSPFAFQAYMSTNGGVVTNVFNTTIITNLTVISNITIGGTNVAVINPTDGRYPYRSSSNSFGDGAIYYIDPTTAGVTELDATTLVVSDLVNGGLVVSDATGTVTNLVAGTGTLHNDGANNLSWVNSDLLWTNSAGVLQPTDVSLTPMLRISSAQVTMGPNNSYFYDDGTQAEFQLNAPTTGNYIDLFTSDSRRYIHLATAPSGDYGVMLEPTQIEIPGETPPFYLSSYNVYTNVPIFALYNGALSSISGVPSFTVAGNTGWTGTGTNYFGDDGKVHPLSGLGGAIINPGDGYIPYRSNATTFADSPILRQNATDVSVGALQVRGDGAGGDGIFSSSASKIISIGAYTNTLRFETVNGFYADWPVPLGTPDYRWGALNALAAYIYGYETIGDVDHSRLAISQASTNANTIIDLQTKGMAGPPQNFSVAFNGTNRFEFQNWTNNASLARGLAIYGTNGTTDNVIFGYKGAGEATITPSAGITWLNSSSYTRDIAPQADNIYSFGTAASNGAFKDSYYKGVQHAVGTNDGTGNYTWLRVFVTNGVAVFDLANGGTGPAPTSISFRTNGIEVGHFP